MNARASQRRNGRQVASGSAMIGHHSRGRRRRERKKGTAATANCLSASAAASVQAAARQRPSLTKMQKKASGTSNKISLRPMIR